MKTIAFVDDEQSILDGLRRMLRKKHKEWDMHFYNSGDEALQSLKDNHYDVIISDLRMPQMNGAEFLNKVRKESPETVRLALSGYAEDEIILESVHATHQFIAKPAELQKICQCIENTLSLQELLGNERLQSIIGGIKQLPTLPKIYDELMQELATADASVDRVGNIVAKDIALSTNLLKIVNSAFFGLARHIESPQQATAVLGMDTVKNLALSTSIFSAFTQKNSKSVIVKIEQLNIFSQKIGLLTSKLANASELTARAKDHAQIAGMMVSLGELITLTYREKLEKMNVVENDYPCISSYLLGIWSMPYVVIESVRWHQQPQLSNTTELSPLTIVHLAYALLTTYNNTGEITLENDLIDLPYLHSIVDNDTISQWLEVTNDFCNTPED